MVLTLRELLEAALAHLELKAREERGEQPEMLSEEESEALADAVEKAMRPPEPRD